MPDGEIGVTQVLLRIDLTDDAFAGRAGFLFLHHALADGRHLRTVIGIDDRRDDVAAESGTDLIEQILVDLTRLILGMRADFEARAVGRQTAVQRRRNPSDRGRGLPAWLRTARSEAVPP